MFGDDFRPLDLTARRDRGWHNPVWYSRDKLKAIIVAYPSPIHPSNYTLSERAVLDHAEALAPGKLQSVTIALVKPNDRKAETILRVPLGSVFDRLKSIRPRIGSNGRYWLVDEKCIPVGEYYFDRPPFE